MKLNLEIQKAPENIGEEAFELFNTLCREYGINDEAGLAILRTGIQAFDRVGKARKIIEQQGLTILDKFGQIKVHPLCSVERDARAQWLAALKALNLDLEPLHDRPGKPNGK